MLFSLGLVKATLVCLAFAIPLPVEELQGRALPVSVSVATAKTLLEGLMVAPTSNSPAYDRDLFPTWSTISGTCNTRETVLKRDGTSVVVDSECRSTSGRWVSPYDGAVWTDAADIQIDHIVPLKEAWISGAKDWTTTARRAFANDLTRPQLAAVTGSVNNAKSDKDPANWLPPLTSYHCTYALAWIQVKSFYTLTIDSAEKTALSSILTSKC